MSENRLQPGTYRARGVDGSDVWDQKEKGIQVSFQVQITGGATAWVRLSFSDAAKQYTLDKLRAMGARIDTSGEPKLVGLGANEVGVNVSYETYQGKEQMKVDVFAGAASGGLDAREKNTFLRSIAGELGKAAAQPGKDYPAGWDDKPAGKSPLFG